MMLRPATTRLDFGAALRHGISALSCIALVACGGDSGTTPAPPAVGVSVSPSSASVGAAESQTITATVSNASNSAVTWSSTGGTVSGSGTSISWTAPLSGGSYSITATSAQDATKSATATITVTPVQVAVSPTAPALLRGESTTLTATVTGTSASTDVSWVATCGTLTAAGNTATYQAPETSGSCDVTATSDLDTSMSATAAIAVRQASAVTSDDDTDDGACTFDHCSLREAINAANLVAGTDTVYLSVAAAAAAPGAVAGRAGAAAGFGGAAVIQATTSLPTIVSDLTIIGEGPGVTEIDMQASALDRRRAFDVSAADGPVTVNLHGLTVKNAVAMGGPALYVRGGAVVHTMDVSLRGNTSIDGEGGAMVVVGQGSSAVLVNSVIDDNEVLNGFPGGGVGVVGGGSFEMMGGSLTNNRTTAWGGGLRGINADLISFENTVIDGNQVIAGGFGGGGMFIENPENAGGVVRLTGVTLTNNSTIGGGGGAHLRDNLDITITNSSITGNSATEGGGIVAGESTLVIDNTTIDTNRGDSRGGGLLLYGSTTPVTFTGGSVSNNTAGASGGAGIFAQQDVAMAMTGTHVNENVVDVDGGAGGGFGLFNNVQLTATDVQINDNVAPAAGGIYIFGSGGLTVDLTTSTVDANRTTGATFSGGGILADGAAAVMLDRTTLSSNVSLDGSGGGLSAQVGVTVDIVDSFVLDNTADVSGGGLWLRGPTLIDRTLIGGNDAGSNGGAISAGSDVVVQNSTLSGNTAGDRGGAIFFFETGATPLRILNSTMSGNMADRGGALGIMGDAEVVHSTVVGNSATGIAGAFWVQNVTPGGSITATNTLFGGNTLGGVANSCAADPTEGGTFPSGGGNLVDDATCAFGLSTDQNDTAAGVDAALDDNGGPTPTHALVAGSAAIDAGVDAGLSTDQRGQARVGAPDVGAFELGG